LGGDVEGKVIDSDFKAKIGGIYVVSYKIELEGGKEIEKEQSELKIVPK
jgi:hypothetical protein